MGRSRPAPRDCRRTAPPPLPEVDGGSWPAGVSFIGDYVWAPDVGAELRAKYAGEPSRREPASPSCCTAVRIKHITDPRHPACGEFGLVASVDLQQGQHILDYLGAVSVAEDRTSDYVVDFGEHSELALDALTVGNEARFVRSAPPLLGRSKPSCAAVSSPASPSTRTPCVQINDYRNTGQHANVEFKLRRGERGELRQGVYVSDSTKYIRAGSELLISYGKSYWKSRVGPDLDAFVYRRPGE